MHARMHVAVSVKACAADAHNSSLQAGLKSFPLRLLYQPKLVASHGMTALCCSGAVLCCKEASTQVPPLGCSGLLFLCGC